MKFINESTHLPYDAPASDSFQRPRQAKDAPVSLSELHHLITKVFQTYAVAPLEEETPLSGPPCTGALFSAGGGITRVGMHAHLQTHFSSLQAVVHLIFDYAC